MSLTLRADRTASGTRALAATVSATCGSARAKALVRVAQAVPRTQKVSTSKSADARIISYRVQRGDTLYSIARRFDVDMVALKRWNNISGKRGLQSGTRVTIPSNLKS